jgi:hypothetical protein
LFSLIPEPFTIKLETVRFVRRTIYRSPLCCIFGSGHGALNSGCDLGLEFGEDVLVAADDLLEQLVGIGVEELLDVPHVFKTMEDREFNDIVGQLDRPFRAAHPALEIRIFSELGDEEGGCGLLQPLAEFLEETRLANQVSGAHARFDQDRLRAHDTSALDHGNNLKLTLNKNLRHRFSPLVEQQAGEQVAGFLAGRLTASTIGGIPAIFFLAELSSAATVITTQAITASVSIRFHFIPLVFS